MSNNNRVLHVCYKPSLLLDQEKLLVERGYEVVTVLGTDGLLAARELNNYDLILLAEGASSGERGVAVRFLTDQISFVPILAVGWPDTDLMGVGQPIQAGDPELVLNAILGKLKIA